MVRCCPLFSRLPRPVVLQMTTISQNHFRKRETPVAFPFNNDRRYSGQLTHTPCWNWNVRQFGGSSTVALRTNQPKGFLNLPSLARLRS
jgi:hypothetical protein